MAITKCLHMKQAKTGYPAKHLANGLRYIMNPEKQNMAAMSVDITVFLNRHYPRW